MNTDSFSSDPYIEVSEDSSDSSLSMELKKLGNELFRGIRYDKYLLALKKNIPFEYTTEINNEAVSIPDLINEKKSITENWNNLLKNKIKISRQDFINIYYISSSKKGKDYILSQINKLYKIFNLEEFDKISGYEFIEKIKSNIQTLNKKTSFDFKELENFYKKIETYKTSENYKDVIDTFKINMTSSEFSVKDGNYKFNKENALVIFNSLSLNNLISYAKLIIDNKKYYKIYSLGEKKYENFIESNNELNDSNNSMYLFYDIKTGVVTKTEIIFFNFENSTCTINYEEDTLDILIKEITNLIPNIKFERKKEENKSGSFEITIKNFSETKLYYLTLFSKIFYKFLYIREDSSVRSLKENIKYYFTNYEEKDKPLSYSIYFYIKKLYLDKYSIEFRSSESSVYNIHRFILIILKLFYYYNNLEPEDERYLPFILNKYTGVTGDGLGGDPDDYKINYSSLKTKKIDYLFSKNKELFQKRLYARNCPCPKQPIPIEKEDVDDWKKYKVEGKNRNVVLFPPEKSSQRVSKVFYVCPDDEFSVFSLKENPDKNSKYPLIPCCNSTNFAENLYESYDMIRKNPSEFWSDKENYKGKNSNILKTFKTLNSGRLGILPDYVSDFLQNVEKTDFLREGVYKSSKSSFLHCLITVFNTLSNYVEFPEKSENSGPKWMSRNYFEGLKDFSAKYIKDTLEDREYVIKNFRSFFLKRVLFSESNNEDERKEVLCYPEICSQEFYDLEIEEVRQKILNPDFPLESKYFFRLFEYIFGINIFVFTYDKFSEKTYLELPRGDKFNIRFVNENYPSVFLLNHKNKYSFDVYEIIRKKKENKEKYIFDQTYSIYMKSYLNSNFEYYNVHNVYPRGYNIYRNVYNNIDWSIILNDYKLQGQVINSSGRCCFFKLQISPSSEKDNVISIFTDTAPLNTFSLNSEGDSLVIPIANKKIITSMFGNKYVEGSEGLWFPLNDLYFGFFIPCSGVSQKNINKCNNYEILKTKNNEDETINNIDKCKYNSNIFVQIIRWLYLTSKLRSSDWIKKYLVLDKKINKKIFSSEKFNIPVRLPLAIKTVEKGIDYFNNYIPVIFNDNKIYLYPELYKAITRNLNNFEKNNFGIQINRKEVFTGIFTRSKDFKRVPFNYIKDEEEFNIWKNNISVNYSDVSKIMEENIYKTEPYPFKLKETFFIIQNNSGNSLEKAKVLSKIFQIKKINLGYNFFNKPSIWSILREYYNDYNFGWDLEKLIKYIETYIEKRITIKDEMEAFDYLIERDIPFFIEKDITHIIYGKNTSGKIVSIKRVIFDREEPVKIYQYSDEDYCSMLPLN